MSALSKEVKKQIPKTTQCPGCGCILEREKDVTEDGKCSLCDYQLSNQSQIYFEFPGPRQQALFGDNNEEQSCKIEN